MESKQISLNSITYFILINIPINDYGYKQISNLKNHTEEKKQFIEKLPKLLSDDVRKKFRSDESSHSFFEISIEDDSTMQIISSYIFSDLEDESGRKGIVFGLFFELPFENFSNIPVQTVRKKVFEFFEEIKKKHVDISKNYLKSEDTENTVKDLKSFTLKSFEEIIFPCILFNDQPEVNIEKIIEILKKSTLLSEFIKKQVSIEVDNYLKTNNNKKKGFLKKLFTKKIENKTV